MKVKKRAVKIPAQLTYKKRINYYLSSWIANFGVVPLLLFAAFLFFPEETFFLALLFFVTRVFETISKLRNFFNIQLKTGVNLLTSMLDVNKSISPCILLLLLSHSAKAAPHNGSDDKSKTIIMARGSHKEIEAANLKNYAIGNKEVLNIKLLKKRKQLIIQGKKLGFSEVIVWKKNNGKTSKVVYKIYILSKREHFKIANISESLNEIGVTTKITGKLLKIEKDLETISQYESFLVLYRKTPEIFHLKSHLSKSLRNEIIGEIYFLLLSNNIQNLRCESQKVKIICYHDITTPIPDYLQKHLVKKYWVNFIPMVNNENSNFSIKLKIIQIEKLDGKEFSLGLSSINTNITEIFQSDLRSFLSKNPILINNQNLQISTVAEPQTLISANGEATLQMGASIPYEYGDKDENKKMWKFAGLKVELNLKKELGKLKLQYKTEFTKPENQTVSGNKESSTISVIPKTPIKIFEIGYKTNAKLKEKLPLLSRIPLLGKLFVSKNNKDNYKKVEGFLYLEEKVL